MTLAWMSVAVVVVLLPMHASGFLLKREADVRDEQYCDKCNIDGNGGDGVYYVDCDQTNPCPSELVAKMTDVKNGLVEERSQSSSLIALNYRGDTGHVAVLLSDEHFSEDIDLGPGDGNDLISSCIHCDVIYYENGIGLWNCKESQCHDAFSGPFSWVPFKPLTTSFSSGTCLQEIPRFGVANIYCNFFIA